MLEIINNIRQQLDALEAQIKQMPAAKPTGTSLDELYLSPRARHALERMGINTVEVALTANITALAKRYRVGLRVLSEIKEQLETRRQTLYKEELERMKQC